MPRKLFLTAGLVLTIATGVVADRLDSINEKFVLGDAKLVVVRCDFSAGQLNIVPSDMEEVAAVDLEFDADIVDCEATYETRGGKGYLDLTSDMHKRRHHDGDIDNEWQVTLSKRYPSDIELEVGACEMDVDLGGIPISRLLIDIGAADGLLEFSEPNPQKMRELEISVGASSFDCVMLGNANFESLHFESGAASGELDLRGTYSGECEIEIEVGAGSLDVILPSNVPVRVEGDDGWFSSIDFHGGELEKVRRGIWESPGYEKAETRMVIQLDVGMGSVDFSFKD